MRKVDLPPTQKELAKALGMAQSTVSMALRGHFSITAKTREQVLQAAAAMGYHPNPSGTALAHLRQTSKVQSVKASLAWLNSWPEPGKLRSYREIDRYWDGSSQEAADLGYRLDEFIVGRDLPLPKLAKILHTRNVRGILIPPGPSPEGWQEFNWDAFSVVRLSHLSGAESLPACSVMGDQTNNALVAWRNIRRKGYERIGFVGNPDPRGSFAAGFLWGQQEVAEHLRIPPFLMSYGNPVEWAAGLRAWFLANRPDAILTDIAELPAALTQMGLKVPADLGLAALGILDCPVSAGIEQNSREIGRLGVHMLHSLIKDGALGLPKIHRELMVKGTWVDGDSLPDRADLIAVRPRKKASSPVSVHPTSNKRGATEANLEVSFAG